MLFAGNVISETKIPLEVQRDFGPAAYISPRTQWAIIEREEICVYVFRLHTFRDLLCQKGSARELNTNDQG